MNISEYKPIFNIYNPVSTARKIINKTRLNSA